MVFSRATLALAAVLVCACGSSSAQSSSVSSAGTSSATLSGPDASTTSSGGGTSTTSSGGPAAIACGPSSARTVAASSRARVYASHGVVVGCASGSQRRFVLGRSGLCIGATRVAPVSVTGVLAAYGAERCGVDTGSTQVIVRRLTDGAILTQTRATNTLIGPESYVQVTALVLARDGAAAWISTGSSIVGHRHIDEVHAYEQGTLRRLDSGSAIDLYKLELSGSHLRWKHGASWMTATLS